jgi:hypothetical protein
VVAFSATIAGLARELEIHKQGLGKSLSELRDILLKKLGGLEIDQTVKDFVKNALLGIDLSTPEGQKALQQLVTQLKQVLVGEGPFSLQDLGMTSFEEMEDLINVLEMLSGGGTGEGEFTKSVQIARSITEVQAAEMVVQGDEMIWLLGQILTQIHLLVRAASNAGNLPSAVQTPGFQAMTTINRAIANVTTAPSVNVSTLTSVIRQQWTVDVGGITVTGVPNQHLLTERQIDQLVKAFGEKLRDLSADRFRVSSR